MLKPVLGMECGVAETRVRRRVPQTHVGWDTELLRLTLESRCGVLQTRVRCRVTQTRIERDVELLRLALNASLLRPTSEVSIFLWTRGPHLSLKRDLRVEVRFASDDLSLVIFGKPIEPPPKFLKLRS